MKKCLINLIGFSLSLACSQAAFANEIQFDGKKNARTTELTYESEPSATVAPKAIIIPRTKLMSCEIVLSINGGSQSDGSSNENTGFWIPDEKLKVKDVWFELVNNIGDLTKFQKIEIKPDNVTDNKVSLIWNGITDDWFDPKEHDIVNVTTRQPVANPVPIREFKSEFRGAAFKHHVPGIIAVRVYAIVSDK